MNCLKAKKSAFDINSPSGFLSFGFASYIIGLSNANSTSSSTPTVSIQNIKEGEILNSSFITGSATDKTNITSIEVSIDDGAYQTVSGITAAPSVTWKMKLPITTNKWKTGQAHKISVKSKNSSNIYSTVSTVNFKIGRNKDINGDGFFDLVLGGTGSYGFGLPNTTGVVNIFYGSTNGIATTPEGILNGEVNFSNFGTSIALGDLDADGYADLVVGAPGYNAGAIDSPTNRYGKVYIFYGSSTGIKGTSSATIATAKFALSSPTNQNRYGYALDIGDVNGDGFMDLAVSANFYNNGSAFGRIYLYHHPTSGRFSDIAENNTATANSYVNGEFGSDVLGQSFVLDDFNADGYSDLAAGAYNYPTAGGVGRVYIYKGSTTGLGSGLINVSNSKIIDGDVVNVRLGESITSGDINNDGISDLIISGFAWTTNTGKVSIFYGVKTTGISANPVTSANIALTGEITNSNFGYSMSVGDFNGDGLNDLAIGANGFNSNSGKIYVFKGGANGLTLTSNNTTDSVLKITGETGSYMGYSVSFSDLNGDGISDLIFGAPAYNTNQGRVYYIYGQSNNFPTATDTTASSVIKITGSANAQIGISVF